MPALILSLVQPAKAWLRGPYRKARSKYVRWRHGFGRSELLAALKLAGVQSGDSVIVHSAIKAFEAFEGNATDIIAVFREAVGAEGTLMMPTLSMSGSAIDFAKSGRIFDPRTTPSHVGLLSEVFRRLPGVVRSVHPTHSVAVSGPDTAWWIADHHLAETPCGRGSPFHRLLERDGKIVLAGTEVPALTFFHCAEELLENRMPFSPFTEERYVMHCKIEGQIIETVAMRLYAADVSRRRRLAPLEERLRAKKVWGESRTGTLTIAAVRARDVLETLNEMADAGVFCYTQE
jgi:aminoglycoside 3-N-acetyltransferase